MYFCSRRLCEQNTAERPTKTMQQNKLLIVRLIGRSFKIKADLQIPLNPDARYMISCHTAVPSRFVSPPDRPAPGAAPDSGLRCRGVAVKRVDRDVEQGVVLKSFFLPPETKEHSMVIHRRPVPDTEESSTAPRYRFRNREFSPVRRRAKPAAKKRGPPRTSRPRMKKRRRKTSRRCTLTSG